MGSGSTFESVRGLCCLACWCAVSVFSVDGEASLRHPCSVYQRPQLELGCVQRIEELDCMFAAVPGEVAVAAVDHVFARWSYTPVVRTGRISRGSGKPGRSDPPQQREIYAAREATASRAGERTACRPGWQVGLNAPPVSGSRDRRNRALRETVAKSRGTQDLWSKRTPLPKPRAQVRFLAGALASAALGRGATDGQHAVSNTRRSSKA